MNLLMCIPPDHMCDDLPSMVQMWLLSVEPSAPFKGIDGQCIDGKVIVMAHRTGRPVA